MIVVKSDIRWKTLKASCGLFSRVGNRSRVFRKTKIRSMKAITAIPVCTYRLQLARRVQVHEAPSIDQVFGKQCQESILEKIYDPADEPRFEYPRIQFKWFDSTAYLWGIGEGSEWLEDLWPTVKKLDLGNQQLVVIDTHMATEQVQIATSKSPVEYRFITPWLALNQKNFRSYTGSRNMKFRKNELSRILVGNCLGITKSLGLDLSEHIDADCRQLTSVKTSAHGKGVIGFVGKFQVNLDLPELLGLGRFVARGFGVVSAA